MLQRKELLLLVVGLLAGAVAGLVVGYGVLGSPAQGDMSGQAVTSGAGNITVDGSQVNLPTLIQEIHDQNEQVYSNNSQLQSYNDRLAERAVDISMSKARRTNNNQFGQLIDVLYNETVDGMSPEELLRLQWMLAQYQTVIELTTKSVDKSGQGVETLLRSQS